MNIREAYKKMQSECDIKVGDTVRITRKAKSHEMGWALTWVEEMDSTVGKLFEVVDVHDNSAGGVRCTALHDDASFWWFPFFVLEVVERRRVPAPLVKVPETLLPRGVTETKLDTDYYIPLVHLGSVTMVKHDGAAGAPDAPSPQLSLHAALDAGLLFERHEDAVLYLKIVSNFTRNP